MIFSDRLWPPSPALHEPQWLLRTATIQFYLGPRASGAQPHWHSEAWNWLAHGLKRWYLWPPADAMYSQSHVTATLGTNRSADGRVVDRPLICDQRPGEIMIVPALWGHATVNLQPSIGWASEFVFDRSYDDGLAPSHGSEWWRVGERPQPNASAGSSIASASEASGRSWRVPVPIALDELADSE